MRAYWELDDRLENTGAALEDCAAGRLALAEVPTLETAAWLWLVCARLEPGVLPVSLPPPPQAPRVNPKNPANRLGGRRQ